MNEPPKFRVVLPTGQKTKPYSRAKITAAVESGKLPRDAVVEVDGSSCGIVNFCEGKPSAAPVVLTEQTSKKYKLMRLCGGGLLVAGAITAILNADEYGVKEGLPMFLTIGLCLAGAITLGVGWALSWWHHA